MRHVTAVGYLIASIFAGFFAVMTVGMALDAFTSATTLANDAFAGLMALIGVSVFTSFLVGAVACYLSGKKRSYLMALPWLWTIFVTMTFCSGQGVISTLSPHHPQLAPPLLTTR
ncbi:MAG: hypothetical protein H6R00_1612 [Proteobacteria bacterium]|nr:hypothetical protein [Pseudomonadota bacterium]